jgi:hypothetical protein
MPRLDAMAQKVPLVWRAALVCRASSARGITVAGKVKAPFNPDSGCCDHLFYRSMAYNLWDVTRTDLNLAPPDNRLWKAYDDLYFGQFLYAENGLDRQPHIFIVC